MTKPHTDTAAEALIPLGQGRQGLKGVVVQVGAPTGGHSSVDPAELERRLIEIGFVEGARVEILHVGLIGGDPLAIKLDDARVALRRREADAVLVRVTGCFPRSGQIFQAPAAPSCECFRE